MLWDIFCKVIDNHGDIGVCWRLSAELAARGEQVRLWVDDASALAWMAPHGHPRRPGAGLGAARSTVEPGDVVIEAFGCDLAPRFQAAIAATAQARGRQPAWINLEYLTAESFARALPRPALARALGPGGRPDQALLLPRLHASAPAACCASPTSMQRQAAFDRARLAARTGHRPPRRRPARQPVLLRAAGPAISCWRSWAARASPPICWSPRGAPRRRCARHWKRNRSDPAWNSASLLSITWLPLLSQPDFDHLLWACDLNFVRGEDSLVRALWAGTPFVWQIYPQDDDAHHAKLAAFLDWLEAPAGLAGFSPCLERHRRAPAAGRSPGAGLPAYSTAASDCWRRTTWSRSSWASRRDLQAIPIKGILKNR